METQLPVIKKIVVPLDGSELAEAALPVAAAIATAADAHIDLVTVALTYEIPFESQMDTLTRRALVRAEAALRAHHEAVNHMILAGDPAEEISNHAAKSDSDLVVIATHGRSGLKRLLLGSVADRLLTLSSVPVVLVRARDDNPVELPLVEAKINRIIVPLDGGETTPAAIPFALTVAKLLSAEAVLLYANEGRETEGGERQLRAFSDVFRQQGVPVTSQVRPGEPGQVIVEAAGGGDMIVMSSLSATGVARGSHRGSVADYVIKRADVPVMIVAPKGYLGSALE